MRRAIEAALHCARCPIICTTCRTYARFSCPVSPFRHQFQLFRDTPYVTALEYEIKGKEASPSGEASQQTAG